ncbi:hypothetical protein K439DRAFT_1656794 [Ramaria rubella]|nr:hypothetical protein K439DRAFT_1656794 [Ramaria rubella]
MASSGQHIHPEGDLQGGVESVFDEAAERQRLNEMMESSIEAFSIQFDRPAEVELPRRKEAFLERKRMAVVADTEDDARSQTSVTECENKAVKRKAEEEECQPARSSKKPRAKQSVSRMAPGGKQMIKSFMSDPAVLKVFEELTVAVQGAMASLHTVNQNTL